jgi:hypothetical protein
MPEMLCESGPEYIPGGALRGEGDCGFVALFFRLDAIVVKRDALHMLSVSPVTESCIHKALASNQEL